ncbi:MAG TPA: hypothetical protein VL442_13355 [Mucilaginibacter sp.]|jgi:hypothetical protein|nr:hypothetical protein [Mucilaginibacter sp.]
MDYESGISDLIIFFADVSADAALNKDLSKFKLRINDALRFIQLYVSNHEESETSLDLIRMGYWLFVFRETIHP